MCIALKRAKQYIKAKPRYCIPAAWDEQEFFGRGSGVVEANEGWMRGVGLRDGVLRRK